MKYFGCFLFLLTFAANSYGWMAHGNSHNPANPGKCTIYDSLIIAPGESVKDPKQCAQIDCNDANGNYSIRGCGAIAPPPNCEWGDMIDIHAPYPECCERHLICHDVENKTNNEAYVENIHRVLQTDAFVLNPSPLTDK